MWCITRNKGVMKMVECCCINCKKRTPTCHGTCEDYKKYRVEWQNHVKLMRKNVIHTGIWKDWNGYRKG